MAEEVEQGCIWHTLENYRATAQKRGLALVVVPHPIPGHPTGINLYEYRGAKMIRWLCFLPHQPYECTCAKETVPAEWKPTAL